MTNIFKTKKAESTPFQTSKHVCYSTRSDKSLLGCLCEILNEVFQIIVIPLLISSSTFSRNSRSWLRFSFRDYKQKHNKMWDKNLLTCCQMLPWNKPIKSHGNQSVQIYIKNGLKISKDFGPENMWHYVANLD